MSVTWTPEGWSVPPEARGVPYAQWQREADKRMFAEAQAAVTEAEKRRVSESMERKPVATGRDRYGWQGIPGSIASLANTGSKA